MRNRTFILPPSSFILVLLCLALFCSCTARDGVGPTAQGQAAKASVNDDEVDAALERAAKAALGDREGTILLMDARTGRLRAVVHPRVAFEQAFPPGSAIKPFTALAALRAGLLDAETTKLCPAHYEREGFHISCTHPKSKSPLDLAHALGHSCNYYFSTIGERLSTGAFDAVLASFGFGERTGVNALNESPGTLRRVELRPGDVIGESERLLVTPVQLASAYAAIVNGGHLYRPQRAPANNFRVQRLARINITQQQRSLLMSGMRGAVHYGTASSARLETLPLQIYGKTGTSSSSNGFRTQGWFVGITDTVSGGGAHRPESERLIVLVFLRRAHGAEGAEIARPIFEEYLRARGGLPHEDESKIAARSDASVEESDGRVADEGQANDGAAAAARFRVKVTARAEGLADVTSTMQTVTLEEYVAGVLAAESSTENELEALKAHAIVIRTFALKNRGRHSGDGFDFCSTTHCERYSFVGAEGERRAPSNSAAIARALNETRGEVLQDDGGQLIDPYFSVACGGMSASIQSLWGTEGAPQYLRGAVRDDYCATEPHRHWTDTIEAAQLLKALRSDPQTDVGARLTDVVITRRDTTGRAELMTLEGERRKTVRGWDFKLIVGRALGWHLLKSSRFVVTRAGTRFVFRGGGFGHGLGLCQEGAHVMAERGSSYRQIVAKYFPGTAVIHRAPTHREQASANSSDSSIAPSLGFASYLIPAAMRTTLAPARVFQNGRLTLSSEHFRVSYGARTDRREVEGVLRLLEAARADIERRLMVARLTLAGAGSLDVVIHETTAQFIAATGQPGWAAAATRGSRTELQPLALLRRRGILQTTLRHEYAHFVIELLGRGRTPRWLSEGLAVHLAGEGPLLMRFRPKSKLTREELEQKLVRPSSAEEMRALYAASYNEVRALIRAEGEKEVWRRVSQPGG